MPSVARADSSDPSTWAWTRAAAATISSAWLFFSSAAATILRGLLLGVGANLRRDVLGAGLGLLEVGAGGVGRLVEQALALAMDLLDLELGRGANRGQLVLDEGVERTDGAVDGAGQAVEVGLRARSWEPARGPARAAGAASMEIG